MRRRVRIARPTKPTAGWLLTNCSIPATVSRTADGRTRLDFLNPRPDELEVVLTARRAI